jgi:pimeloyl-ACP methyl ester carboxylesterase
MSTFVLVHGICHGAWCWQGTSAALEERGHEVVALDLPLTSLEDDVAAVRQALDEIDGSVILVGHSYGGLVISGAAGGRDDVEQLVYVAAVMLDADDVFITRTAEFPGNPRASEVVYTDDGQIVISPDLGIALFYNECEEIEARAAADQLRTTAVACLATAPGAEPWRTIPSTYVLCERDNAIHPDLQRWMSTRAGTTVVFDTDHSPFLSRSEPFVDLLDEVAQNSSSEASPAP